jgi:hypothetical protein
MYVGEMAGRSSNYNGSATVEQSLPVNREYVKDRHEASD